ncbi:hypothetical protein ERO13_D01G112350v2 [Gossypium hirsutum]|nr:hypothetical protein ERO13_D01G112350v2 [Gossypium hirsutum]
MCVPFLLKNSEQREAKKFIINITWPCGLHGLSQVSHVGHTGVWTTRVCGPIFCKFWLGPYLKYASR